MKDPDTTEFTISFPEISGKKANASASSLLDKLGDIDPTLTAQREKVNPNTQDVGSVLTVVLGSAPVAAIAAGLASWIRMRRVDVLITTKGRSVKVSGSSAESARIIEAVFKK